MEIQTVESSHRRNKVDIALLEWFKEKQLQGIHLPDIVLREKARDLNKYLAGDSSFSASQAWLGRWKKNYISNNINYQSVSSKTNSKIVDVDKIINLFADEIEDNKLKKNSTILFIEPFYGGSHKQLIDTLVKEFEDKCEIITLPAKKWHWRARCSALVLSELIPKRRTYQFLFCSSVLNLTELLGLRPDLQKLKKIVYFHENQLVYPKKEIKQRDFQFGYNQITTCFVADIIIFNSFYNMNSFLWNIGIFMKMMPDCRPKDIVRKIEAKMKVIYFPVNFPKISQNRTLNRSLHGQKTLHIVWPHRWEFDKGPEDFFNTLFKLKEEGYKFKLSVLGETFTDVDDIFKKAKEKLNEEITHWGYAQSKNDYYEILKSAHVVVSTAIHEFFGVAMLEAVYCGCYPLVPDRLIYPEIYDKSCLYKDVNELYVRLTKYCSDSKSVQKDYDLLEIKLSEYSSEHLLPQYKTLFALP